MRVCEHNCRYAGIRLRYLHDTHEVFIGVAPAMSRVHVAAEGNDVLEKVELGHFVPPLDAIVAGLRVERSVEVEEVCRAFFEGGLRLGRKHVVWAIQSFTHLRQRVQHVPHVLVVDAPRTPLFPDVRNHGHQVRQFLYIRFLNTVELFLNTLKTFLRSMKNIFRYTQK